MYLVSLVGLCFLSITLTGSAQTQESQRITIPALHGVSLSGDSVVLPDALRGKTGILIIGFSQASREEVTRWARRLAADYRNDPSVLYYEMPVLASVPRMLRGWVTDRIRSDVPERARSRFVPITSNEPAWKATVQYRQPDDAYILVVDGAGRVIWQTQGPDTDSLFNSVHQKVESIRSPAAKF